MTIQDSSVKSKIDKIENILFEKCKNMDNPTLDSDLAAMMFEATYFKYSKDEKFKLRSQYLLNNLLESFHKKELTSGFLEGFEGIFWSINYLKECGVIEDERILDDLIPYLYQSIEKDIITVNFDLLHGCINKLQYLIKSFGIKNKIVNEYLDKFIDSLYNNREEKNGCIFWYDELYEDNKRAINLGYAHGIPSLLVFFVRLKKLGYKKDELDILINGIIFSLKEFKLPFKGDSVYSDVFYKEKGQGKYSSRLGFCYGDLGIAYSLAYAGSHLKRNEIMEEATHILKRALRRTLGNSGIIRYEDYYFFDTAFCHGISGIYYILCKIDNLIPDPFLQKRIQYWKKEFLYNLEIQMKIKDNIRFPFYFQPNDSNPYIIDEENFLLGYPGTGLVLLSLYYEKYDWSDFLLFF